MSLRSTDLNLIPVLRALLEEGSVTAAAAAVGLSQPAASHALNRIRKMLGDPILVRAGRSMSLTPRARRMAKSLGPLCVALEDMLQEPEFEPATAEMVFSLAVPDYVSFLLGEHLLETLAIAAPKVAIRFVDARPVLATALASGEIDAAIIRWAGGTDEDLAYMRGYGDRMVGVVRKGHPLAGSRPTAAELERHDQVRHQRNAVHGPILKPWPAVKGPVSMVSTQFTTAALLVVQCEAFTVVPETLARRLGELLPIASFQLPDDSADFECCVVWDQGADNDPPHRWFRGVLDEAMRARLCTT